MGKPIIREFGQSKGILKFFPYEGAACLVLQSTVSSPDANGKQNRSGRYTVADQR